MLLFSVRFEILFLVELDALQVSFLGSAIARTVDATKLATNIETRWGFLFFGVVLLVWGLGWENRGKRTMGDGNGDTTKMDTMS